jgi:hypothetical protein
VVEVEDIANVIGTLNRVDWRRELCVGRKVCGNGVRTGVAEVSGSSRKACGESRNGGAAKRSSVVNTGG